MRRSVVRLAEAATGSLPVRGGGGSYHILIDEPTTGARSFSLLVNEIRPGFAGREHTHDVEHGMYFIRGRGRFTLDGNTYPVEPGTAVFVPPQAPHSLACEGEEPLQYVVIYAPGGTEQELRAKGESAFAR
jgi:mannose-6-phosphate isomerase-like protein (cupin superfamily)